MAPEDTDPGFQIRDRRRQPPEEPAIPIGERREPSPGRPGAPPPSAPSAPSTPSSGGPSRPAERNLIGLFMMLGSLALAGLEGVEDPATGQMQRDPMQAAEVIDILMLLREKTEGRRTPDEARILEELIYDLQIRYVRATRPS